MELKQHHLIPSSELELNSIEVIGEQQGDQASSIGESESGTSINTDAHLLSPNNESKMTWDASTISLSIGLFIIAGILEVGGGYLVWLGIREKKWPYIFIPIGALVLIAYGVVPTFQPVSSFGRVYAVYGGFFILLAYLWAYIFDGFKPDAGDYVGAAIALIGVCVTWFWPR